MNLFRSEECIRRWEDEHRDLESETLRLDVALAWVTFIGRERPRYEYTHPRVTGQLLPFLRSIGLVSDWWKPPKPR
jgi:hypothetical protein